MSTEEEIDQISQRLIKQLRKDICKIGEGIRKRNEAEYEELMRKNQHYIHWLKTEEEAIIQKREFINKKLINVSKPKHQEAVISLKREGCKGKALINQEEFASELSKNNILYISLVPKDVLKLLLMS